VADCKNIAAAARGQFAGQSFSVLGQQQSGDFAAQTCGSFNQFE